MVKHKIEHITYRKKDFICTFPLITWEEYYPSLFYNKGPSLTSIEKFPLHRLKALQEFLQDELDLSSVDQETKKWYENNLKKINNILNGTQGEVFSSLTHVYHSNTYKQTIPKIPIGRLYSEKTFSYMYLPREIRGFLIENEYIDFDIANSHPVLLLEFAREHISDVTFEYLETYVLNREDVLALKAKFDNTSKSDAKIAIIKTLNTSRDHANNLGYFCSPLFEEVNQIRKHIVSFTKKDMVKYFKDKQEFVEKSSESQEISIQNLFLQTKETDYIMLLVQYLISETTKRMDLIPEKETFNNLTLDRYVSCPDWFFYFYFVPFFDGLYIGTEDVPYINELKKHVHSYNLVLEENNSLVQFIEKPIEHEFSRLNKDKLNFYLAVNRFMRDIDTKQLKELFILLDMEQLNFKNSDQTDMELRARMFRQQLYSKIQFESDNNKLVLNPKFLPKLREKYKERMRLYRDQLKYEDEVNPEDFISVPETEDSD